jgi:hypothetical protein
MGEFHCKFKSTSRWLMELQKKENWKSILQDFLIPIDRRLLIFKNIHNNKKIS